MQKSSWPKEEPIQFRRGAGSRAAQKNFLAHYEDVAGQTINGRSRYSDMEMIYKLTEGAIYLTHISESLGQFWFMHHYTHTL